jgi:hypothetical protein
LGFGQQQSQRGHHSRQKPEFSEIYWDVLRDGGVHDFKGSGVHVLK